MLKARPLQATFKPQIHVREAPVDPKRAALLFVDVQNFSCHPSGACHESNPNVRLAAMSLVMKVRRVMLLVERYHVPMHQQ